MENIIEKTKGIVDSTQEKVNNNLIFLVNFFKNHLVGFIRFLFDRNIIQTGVGIIIATNISKITIVIVDAFITPIIKRLSFGTVDDINNWELELFDIKIKIGLILVTILNFLFTTVVVYHIWKLSQIINTNVINDLLDITKDNINKSKTNVVISVSSNQ